MAEVLAVPEPTFRLREAVPGDAAFLRRVYAGTRQEELAWLPVGEAGREAFLELQFTAQDRQFRQQEGAEFLVISQGEQDVGRLVLARTPKAPGTPETGPRPGCLRVVDLSLLPEWRGRGLGTAVLQSALSQADRDGRSAELHVAEHNPARRLYERLGFVVTDVHPVYLQMVRPAASAEDGLEQ